MFDSSKNPSTSASSQPALHDFLALSRILTGVTNLDSAIGNQYFDRLMSSQFQPYLTEILRRFRQIDPGPRATQDVRKNIVLDDELRPTISQIILLWYTSAMRDSGSASLSLRFGTEEAYFSGLVWWIIGAHPLGLSGGYFGHWRYRPENEPKGTAE